MKTGYRFHRVASFIFAAVFAVVSARAELTVGSLTSGEDASVREVTLPYGARAVVFTNGVAGQLTLTLNGKWNLLRALVVGGGGSGGAKRGAGGGAGGYIELDYRAAPIAMEDGTSITLQVGAGAASRYSSGQGNTGGSSVLTLPARTTYTALGGGGGGCWNNSNNSTTPCASAGGANSTGRAYSGVIA